MNCFKMVKEKVVRVVERLDRLTISMMVDVNLPMRDLLETIQ